MRQMNSSAERYTALISCVRCSATHNSMSSTQPSTDDAKRGENKNQLSQGQIDTPNQSSRTRFSPDPQLVSNARGTFPRLELQSVSPRRHHTFHGMGGPHHMHHRGPPPPPPPHAPSFATGPRPSATPARLTNPFMPPALSPAAQNVMRRLADVSASHAFVATTHRRTYARMPSDGFHICHVPESSGQSHRSCLRYAGRQFTRGGGRGRD